MMMKPQEWGIFFCVSSVNIRKTKICLSQTLNENKYFWKKAKNEGETSSCNVVSNFDDKSVI